jgi:CRP/FNR family transcriptional regulator, cyclic AMP receptor protein
MFRFTSDDAPDLPDEVLTGALFAGVPTAGRQAFLAQLTHLSAAPGTTLYAQGEAGDTLWIVLSGEVTVRRVLEDGRVVELDRAGPGDVFGEMAIISPAPRSGSAVVESDAELLVLRRAQYRQLLSERDPAAEALLRTITLRICRRLRQIDARIALAHDVQRPGVDLSARIAGLPLLGRAS